MNIELQKVDLSQAELKAASAATLALARVSEADAVQSVAQPGQWSAVNIPGADATRSTVGRAAGGAGVRHVCNSISATMATGANAQTVLSLFLRDGVSGGGTVLWGKQVILPISGLWEVNLSGLNIVGSANTAMTLEFNAAGVVGCYQSVAMTGYDAS